MILRICDRCKKTIEEGPDVVDYSTENMSIFILETGPFELIKNPNGYLPGKIRKSSGKRYSGELCQKCTDEFIFWLGENL